MTPHSRLVTFSRMDRAKSAEALRDLRYASASLNRQALRLIKPNYKGQSMQAE
jgi:hypothetical protein